MKDGQEDGGLAPGVQPPLDDVAVEGDGQHRDHRAQVGQAVGQNIKGGQKRLGYKVIHQCSF